jgi:WD40 repeat protein/transcriptional regulator with XRE-family HTH domain
MENRLPFSQQLKRERELRNWSQADLASMIETDPKTVNRWESGKRMPRPYLRRMLCELFAKSAEEFGLLEQHNKQDQQATRNLYDDPIPLSSEGHTRANDYASTIAIALHHQEGEISTRPSQREQWGEAPHIETFHGRDRELDTLKQWVETLQCRVIAISGMGGMGKTTLAAYFAEQMKHSFEYVFWQSMQNAPPLEHILKQCIQLLSHQQHLDLPEQAEDQITLLIRYLSSHRCLLVLDNMESLLQVGQRAGQFKESYENYRKLLRHVGISQHLSCLIVTSREKPGEIVHLEARTQPVRSLHLTGVGLADGQAILRDRGIFGSIEHWQMLIDHYGGNPLALKLVSEYIKELFEGNIAFFLREEKLAFGNINDLLDQQFDRLSKQEQEILYWLAIERESTPLERVHENLIRPISKGTVLEVLSSLRHRSLVETSGPAQFLLQPVVMEYVTDKLVRQAYQELVVKECDTWTNYAFMKAEATDYVRESQERLILHAIAEQLLETFEKEEIKQRLGNILSTQRHLPSQQRGYLAGNVLNLLNHLLLNLRGMDFSGLTIRQAYLQGISLPDVNFAHAHFISSVFTNTFGNILSVAFSPKSGMLAAGSTTGDIWIYEAMRGTPLRICSGHTDGVWSVAFNSEGQTLASSSDDLTIRLWDVNTGTCLRTLEGHTNRVRSVAFSPNDSILVSGSDDKTIRVWDMITGCCLRTLCEHTEQKQLVDFRIWSVAFSPDGRFLVSGSTDGTVCLWDIQSWSCYKKFQKHIGGIRSIAVNREGTVIASGGNDHTIHLWDVGTGQCLQRLYAHRNRIWSVTFSPDGRFLASGSEDKTVCLWDTSNYECPNILQGHTHGIRSISFSPDAPILASGGEDQTIRLWNIQSGYCLQTLQGYTNRIWSLAFSPDGKEMVSGCEDQTIRLWDVGTGDCLYTIQTRSHGVRCVAFSPTGRTIASGGEDQNIRLWDAGTGLGLRTLQRHTNWIWSVAFNPDGRSLASGSEDQTIKLWDVATGRNLHTLLGHASWVRCVSFSPNGQILASGSDDQTIKLWETRTGRCIRSLREHINRVRSVTFNHDGRILASSSEDQTIRLWDVESGRCFQTLQGHSNWVRSVAFSSDGYTLASGGEDQTVRLWEVNTGRCISILRGHTGRVRSVIFSPTDHLLASASDDGTIIFWDILKLEVFKILRNVRPYEGMNIFHVKGLTEAQKASLRALGAIELSDEMGDY